MTVVVLSLPALTSHGTVVVIVVGLPLTVVVMCDTTLVSIIPLLWVTVVVLSFSALTSHGTVVVIVVGLPLTVVVMCDTTLVSIIP